MSTSISAKECVVCSKDTDHEGDKTYDHDAQRRIEVWGYASEGLTADNGIQYEIALKGHHVQDTGYDRSIVAEGTIKPSILR